MLHITTFLIESIPQMTYILLYQGQNFVSQLDGTVTLACALMNVPTIIGYKLSLLNELFFRVFVPYRGYIGLANLISGEEIFPEYIQDRFTVYNIKKEIKEWVSSDEKLEEIIDRTKVVKQKHNF